MVLDRLRLGGMGFFLFIPLVLWLFTRPPEMIGTGTALLLGLAIIVVHRRVAAPWVFRYAGCRSLWSGATIEEARPTASVRSGSRLCEFGFGSDREAERFRVFAGFVLRHMRWLRLGIFAPLLFFVVSNLSSEVFGWPWFANQREWSLVLFQGVIALTVVSVAVAYRLGPAVAERETVVFPFPVHNLALLGVRNTLLVFAGVGVFWIGRTVVRVVELVG